MHPGIESREIRVVPVNRDWGSACEAARNAITTTLDVPAVRGDRVDFPIGDGAETLSAAEYLGKVMESVETDDCPCIGITDDPLFEDPDSSGTTYFGIGTVGEEAGVVSTDRLQRYTDDETKIRARYRKETLIVAGRLHGVENHRTPDGSWVDIDSTESCVMVGSRGLRAIDDAPEDYCEECWEDIEAAHNPGSFRDLVPDRRLFAWLRTAIPSVRRPAREYPGWMHGLVRILRFWTTLALYGLGIGTWLVALQSGYESVFGAQPAIEIGWLLIAGSIPLGVVTVWFASAIVSGLYIGLTRSDADWD